MSFLVRFVVDKVGGQCVGTVNSVMWRCVVVEPKSGGKSKEKNTAGNQRGQASEQTTLPAC